MNLVQEIQNADDSQISDFQSSNVDSMRFAGSVRTTRMNEESPSSSYASAQGNANFEINRNKDIPVNKTNISAKSPNVVNRTRMGFESKEEQVTPIKIQLSTPGSMNSKKDTVDLMSSPYQSGNSGSRSKAYTSVEMISEDLE